MNPIKEPFIPIDASPPVNLQVSTDGTRKYIFRTAGGYSIETVCIPEQERYTLCISTQAGCRMGCRFCMTGRQGFLANLSTDEILNQIRSVPEFLKLTNIVFMGMGEPFDNLDAVMASIGILTSHRGFNIPPRRITVSTAGVLPGIRVFLEKTRCPLAVSLHSPFADERRSLMPIENAYPLSEVIAVIRQTPVASQRRLFFEYILFKDFNHSQRHVDELARLLQGLRCRINLMRMHPVPGIPLESPDDQALLAFRDALLEKGFVVTVRRSRGHDIAAACGLLAPRCGEGVSA
ncbi:MAG TPA: 23S rRNA (adenine(2503)-C(2))-methyltransferase RlmN [Verrucomicrobia bacterium]|nr:23S rRNA (adenine(2503)-C(2))-methyltransferase RlmN [Verrucomicrobiota bacterium]